MSNVHGRTGVTVPQILVHEGDGLTLSVETRDGTLFRGRASNTEDNFNLHLDDVTVTSPSGATRVLERVYLRGSSIVFIIFPDILARSPVFARVRTAAEGRVHAVGLGRARAIAIQKAQNAPPAPAGGAGRGVGRGRGGGGGGGSGPPDGAAPPQSQSQFPAQQYNFAPRPMGPPPAPPFAGGGGGGGGGFAGGVPPPAPGSGRGLEATRPAWQQQNRP